MPPIWILDTHALIWYLEGNPCLGEGARAVIDSPQSRLVLPIIALAEAAYIVEKGRTSIPGVEDLLNSVLSDPRVELYPLDWDVLQQSLTLTSIPEMHDRQIVATALVLAARGYNVALLTQDSTMIKSGVVAIIWEHPPRKGGDLG